MDLSSTSMEDESGTTREAHLTSEIALLTTACDEEIKKINEAALLHQNELSKQLEWSKEEQEANIKVCRIRLKRGIERLHESTREIGTDGAIRKLPVELLSYVFRAYVDCHFSPWRLTKVCKGWMRTALETPHLWRYICVTPKVRSYRDETWVVSGEKRVSWERMQVCNTTVQLNAAVRRSGAVSLEIEVEGALSKGDNLTVVLRLIHIILSDPVSQRIERLVLANAPSLKQTDLPIGRFPLLRELTSPTRVEACDSSIFASVSSTAIRIDTLRLNCDISLQLVKCTFWPFLKRLELYGSSRFNSISDKPLNLEELLSSAIQWPDHETRVVTWKKLRHAELQCHPKHLDRVLSPNLEVLVFRDVRYAHVRADTLDTYPSCSFPSLTKLDASTPDPRWLPTLSLPLLTDLTVSCSTSDADVLPGGGGFIFTTNTFPTVKYLTLKTRWNDSVIADILLSMPRLVRATLTFSRYKDTGFGLLLLPRLAANEPLICPNLASLTLGTQHDPFYTLKKKAVPLLKRLVSTRKKMGKPLGTLLVCWSKNSTAFESYV